MKISRISLYQTVLPYVGGVYGFGRGRVLTEALSSVVVVQTDAGVSGCGESCPIGSNYLPAYARGIPAAVGLLAPALLGQDPRQPHRIGEVMDAALLGHPYAKSALDIACWDILGKVCDLPVHTLLGGELTHGAPMYRVIPQKPVDEMRAEMEAHRASGYRQFQIKVGGDWRQDIENILAVASLLQAGETAYADANTGWTVREAVQVGLACKETGVMMEQPCPTYEECLHVRRRCPLPMKLDECVTDMRAAHRIVEDQAAEVVCLKLSNLGGLSKARAVRDYLTANGLSVVAEDTWGGEITTAAVAHFAASTPQALLYNTTDLCRYHTTSTGHPAPEAREGKLYASTAAGLGVAPLPDALGAPLVVVE